MALLAQGFTTGARQSTSAQYATRAAILAQRVITDLETGFLDTTTNQNGTFDDEPDFTYDTTVETTDLTNLNKVTVAVRWKERNVDQSFSLVRLFRNGSTAGTTGSTTTPSTTPSTGAPK
jgi:hypothetical protein